VRSSGGIMARHHRPERWRLQGQPLINYDISYLRGSSPMAGALASDANWLDGLRLDLS
jgi:hypothetical protein